MNSAEHPQLENDHSFCPIHWAYIDVMKEVEVWASMGQDV